MYDLYCYFIVVTCNRAINSIFFVHRKHIVIHHAIYDKTNLITRAGIYICMLHSMNTPTCHNNDVTFPTLQLSNKHFSGPVYDYISPSINISKKCSHKQSCKPACISENMDS